MKSSNSLRLPYELEQIRLQLVGAIDLITRPEPLDELNPACAIIDAAVWKLIEIEKRLTTERDKKVPRLHQQSTLVNIPNPNRPKKAVSRKAKEVPPAVQ